MNARRTADVLDYVNVLHILYVSVGNYITIGEICSPAIPPTGPHIISYYYLSSCLNSQVYMQFGWRDGIPPPRPTALSVCMRCADVVLCCVAG